MGYTLSTRSLLIRRGLKPGGRACDPDVRAASAAEEGTWDFGVNLFAVWSLRFWRSSGLMAASVKGP